MLARPETRWCPAPGRARYGVADLIDGYHTFDAVLIDFSLASLVSDPGAYIILDDVWMPSNRKAVSFTRSNRPDFTRVLSPVTNLAVFHTDKRKWDHFVPF
jgi:hypothetical protein